METYVEQGTAGQTLRWEGPAAKPPCPGPSFSSMQASLVTGMLSKEEMVG